MAFLHPVVSVPLALQLLTPVVAFAVLIGVMLPITCIIAMFLQLFLARVTGEMSPLLAAISALHVIALALLGAGAYSVDAILYGRRVVVLPKDN